MDGKISTQASLEIAGLVDGQPASVHMGSVAPENPEEENAVFGATVQAVPAAATMLLTIRPSRSVEIACIVVPREMAVNFNLLGLVIADQEFMITSQATVNAGGGVLQDPGPRTTEMSEFGTCGIVVATTCLGSNEDLRITAINRSNVAQDFSVAIRCRKLPRVCPPGGNQ